MVRGLLSLVAAVVLVSCTTAQTTPAPSPSSVVLTANVSAVPSNAFNITITWSGVASPSQDDAVAYILPASTTNYSATPPAKFKWASESPTHLSTGAGSLTFRILNTRQPVRFIFATNITSWTYGQFEVLATTADIPMANPNSPTQIHLAPTNITGQINVQWTTANETANPIVQYGTQSGVYTKNVTATYDTYTRSDMCGGEAATTGWIDPGVFNNALLTILSASTRYYYVVGDPTYGVSAEYSFVTAPPVGTDETVKIFAIADLGYCESDGSLEWESDYPNPITTTPPNSTAALQVAFDNALFGDWLSFCAGRQTILSMTADPFNATLFVHNGDISYAQGFGYGWEVYMDMMQPILAERGLPYIIVQGNHERDFPYTGDRYTELGATDSGGECGVIAEKRFPAPIPGPGEQWFAYGYGPIWNVGFSTEIDFAPGSPQHLFVYEQVSTVNRTTYPWLFIHLHRPYFEPSVYGTNFKGDIGNQNDLQAAFDDMFYEYGVDATFFGHTHWYSRSCPVYKHRCMANAADGSATAPVHINIGNAGASFSWDVLDPALMAQDVYVAMAMDHGYSRLTVNRTSFQFEMVNNHDGALMDTFTLTKPANWSNNSTAKSAVMSSFIGNFTYTWQEVYSADEQENGVIDAGESALFSSPSSNSLLASMAKTDVLLNPNTGPDGFETFETDSPIWLAIDNAFKTYVLNANTTTDTIKYYYEKVYGPIFQLVKMFPNGVFKGPLASAPAPSPEDPGVNLLQKTTVYDPASVAPTPATVSSSSISD